MRERLILYLLVLWLVPSQAVAEEGFDEYSQESAYEEALQEANQNSISGAQQTMASLFGKNAVIGVPAQLAGGTLTGPEFTEPGRGVRKDQKKVDSGDDEDSEENF